MIGERGDYTLLHYRTGPPRAPTCSLDPPRLGAPQPARQRPALRRLLAFVRPEPAAPRALACASAIGSEMRVAGSYLRAYHADPVLGEESAFRG